MYRYNIMPRKSSKRSNKKRSSMKKMSGGTALTTGQWGTAVWGGPGSQVAAPGGNTILMHPQNGGRRRMRSMWGGVDVKKEDIGKTAHIEGDGKITAVTDTAVNVEFNMESVKEVTAAPDAPPTGDVAETPEVSTGDVAETPEVSTGDVAETPEVSTGDVAETPDAPPTGDGAPTEPADKEKTEGGSPFTDIAVPAVFLYANRVMRNRSSKKGGKRRHSSRKHRRR
jgi:hypothetical protein